jgi:hypothetical protein
MRPAGLAFLIFALCGSGGCAVVPQPIDKAASPQKIASDAKLPGEQFDAFIPCGTAHAEPGAKLAIFQPCFYVGFSDGAAIVVFDEKHAAYRLLQRLDAREVHKVAMQKMGRGRQIQVHGKGGFIVFDLLSKDRMWGNPSAAEAAYEHLKAVGIPETEPVRMVANYSPIRVRVQP